MAALDYKKIYLNIIAKVSLHFSFSSIFLFIYNMIKNKNSRQIRVINTNK